MRNTLLVASTYLPPICGGAEWVAWDIAKRLADRFEVHMLTTDEGSAEIRAIVEVHTVPRHKWLPITYSSIYRDKVKKILKDVSADIIHCHMVLPWGYVLRNARTPKIITCHEARKPNQIDRYFMKSALRHADVITTPSKWSSEYIHSDYGRQALTIPNGVETEIFRRLLDIERNDNVVLYVGRFTRNKGALDLVEAARALPEYQFWFRGSAEPVNVGRQGVEIPHLPNIRLIDFLPDRHALAALYNQATICAFPSQYENFPLVGLEAMACGRAVVATKGPRNGFSDYLEDGREGILVAPHDIKGLVDAIRYLMKNKSERDEFEKNAIEKAAQYDWRIIAERYASLLEQVMHR
jgi:glycosyltransferase involved in cell wall biosynthesis